MKPDIELLRRWFSYNPDTGLITRKLKARSNIPDVLNPNRERIDFLGVRYRVTHVAWALHHGKWPDEYIDHKDHNRKNNKLENLREATHAQNTRYRKNNNVNGKGVTYHKNRKDRPWHAQIQLNGNKMNLGFFNTNTEAAEAYAEAAKKYHGEFACVE